ncbi:MAG: DHH family phosphoesterase [Bacteroidales bacterium]|nr:DHH family phosphoesterase [Bacteroidales bacterium]
MAALKFDNEDIETFRSALLDAKRVALVGHANPDGDCIGSILALKHLLTDHMGKRAEEVAVALPNACPDTFDFLQGYSAMLNADNQLDDCKKAILEADVIVCLDLNAARRTGALEQPLLDAKGRKIMLDHHHGPDANMFSPLFLVPDLSSTCELLYWVVLQGWGECALNTEMARCLYCGFITDTGTFSYSNEEPSLYEATAGLMRFPIQAAEVQNRIYNSDSVARVRFLGFCLAERLRIFEEEHFAYFYISQEDLQRFGVKGSELEGFVNYTLSMKGIEVGALMKETTTGTVRISLRSKHDFDVNQFARKYFSGGGHTKAAGATSYEPLDATVAKMETYIRKELKR